MTEAERLALQIIHAGFKADTIAAARTLVDEVLPGQPNGTAQKVAVALYHLS